MKTLLCTCHFIRQFLNILIILAKGFIKMINLHDHFQANNSPWTKLVKIFQKSITFVNNFKYVSVRISITVLENLCALHKGH